MADCMTTFVHRDPERVSWGSDSPTVYPRIFGARHVGEEGGGTSGCDPGGAMSGFDTLLYGIRMITHPSEDRSSPERRSSVAREDTRSSPTMCVERSRFMRIPYQVVADRWPSPDATQQRSTSGRHRR